MSSRLQFLLIPFSWLYGAVVYLYHRMYDLQIKKSVSFEIPVISIGNLSVGGTGKTPHVEYLIRLFKDFYDIGILSRGYRRKTKGYLLLDESSSAQEAGDEPVQFKHKFPEVMVAVCEERAIGIPIMLLDNPKLQVVILDDAFQHRRVSPGLSILLTEYSNPFTRDRLLPAGRLRESKNNAVRADLIVVNKCPPQISPDEKIQLSKELALRPDQFVFFSHLKYGTPFSFFNPDIKLTLQKNDSVVLFCGIANPQLLEEYLSGIVHEIEVLKFADHHQYSVGDLKKIQSAFQKLKDGRRFLVTTEKDAVRLSSLKEYIVNRGLEIYCMPVEAAFFEEDRLKFNDSVNSYVAQSIINRNDPEI